MLQGCKGLSEATSPAWTTKKDKKKMSAPAVALPSTPPGGVKLKETTAGTRKTGSLAGGIDEDDDENSSGAVQQGTDGDLVGIG